MSHKHYSSWRNFCLQELFTYNENSERGIQLQELNGTNKKIIIQIKMLGGKNEDKSYDLPTIE